MQPVSQKWENSTTHQNCTVRYFEQSNLLMMQVLYRINSVKGQAYTYQCINQEGKKIIKDALICPLNFELQENHEQATLTITLPNKMKLAVEVEHNVEESKSLCEALRIDTILQLRNMLPETGKGMLNDLLLSERQKISEISTIKHDNNTEGDRTILNIFDQSFVIRSEPLDYSLGPSNETNYMSFGQINKPCSDIEGAPEVPKIPFLIDKSTAQLGRITQMDSKFVSVSGKAYSQVQGKNQDQLRVFQFETVFRSIQSQCGIGIKSKYSSHKIHLTSQGTLINTLDKQNIIERQNIVQLEAENGQHGLFTKNQKVSVVVGRQQNQIAWYVAGNLIHSTVVEGLPSIVWVPLVMKFSSPCVFKVDG